jgi:HNH endonuclease/NUMOD4 motif
MNKERWIKIKGINDYEFSSLGRVKSLSRKVVINGNIHQLKEKILKPWVGNKLGHLQIAIRVRGRVKGFWLHRLILEAFKGPCPEGMECRHKDGNPINNKISNLRWGTHKRNVRDQIKHGTLRPPPSRIGEANNKTKISKKDALRIKRIFSVPQPRGTIAKVAREFGVSRDIVSSIAKGKYWKHLSISK